MLHQGREFVRGFVGHGDAALTQQVHHLREGVVGGARRAVVAQHRAVEVEALDRARQAERGLAVRIHEVAAHVVDEGAERVAHGAAQAAGGPGRDRAVAGADLLGRGGQILEIFGLLDVAFLEDVAAPVEERALDVDRHAGDGLAHHAALAQGRAEIVVIVGRIGRLALQERREIGIPAVRGEERRLARGQGHEDVELARAALKKRGQAGAVLLFAEGLGAHPDAGGLGEGLDPVAHQLRPGEVVQHDVDRLALVLAPVELLRCGRHGNERHGGADDELSHVPSLRTRS